MDEIGLFYHIEKNIYYITALLLINNYSSVQRLGIHFINFLKLFQIREK